MKLRNLCFLILLISCKEDGDSNDVLISIGVKGRFENEITRYESKDKIYPPIEDANLFVGSSSILLWDIHSYFPEHKILSRGFGGSEYSDVLFYANRIITPYNPIKIFIYAGDNDIASGKTPIEIMDTVKSIRNKIKEKLPNTPVAFISAKPSIIRWFLADKYIIFNGKLKEYAEGLSQTEYIDVWSPALNQNGKVLLNIFEPDGLHLNSQGYLIWKTAIEPHLIEPDQVENKD